MKNFKDYLTERKVRHSFTLMDVKLTVSDIDSDQVEKSLNDAVRNVDNEGDLLKIIDRVMDKNSVSPAGGIHEVKKKGSNLVISDVAFEVTVKVV